MELVAFVDIVVELVVVRTVIVAEVVVVGRRIVAEDSEEAVVVDRIVAVVGRIVVFVGIALELFAALFFVLPNKRS